MLVDSGAAECVMPRQALPNHPVTEGEASKRGQVYLAADGGRIRNQGETHVRFLTSNQQRCQMKWQIADAKKPFDERDPFNGFRA